MTDDVQKHDLRNRPFFGRGVLPPTLASSTPSVFYCTLVVVRPHVPRGPSVSTRHAYFFEVFLPSHSQASAALVALTSIDGGRLTVSNPPKTALTSIFQTQAKAVRLAVERLLFWVLSYRDHSH